MSSRFRGPCCIFHFRGDSDHFLALVLVLVSLEGRDERGGLSASIQRGTETFERRLLLWSSREDAQNDIPFFVIFSEYLFMKVMFHVGDTIQVGQTRGGYAE